MANIISRETGCWLQYQLKLGRYGLKEIAGEANVSPSMVTHFLSGRKDSARVRTAFCKLLGYGSFDKLIAASREYTPAKGGAA
jgi:hypothetical protein